MRRVNCYVIAATDPDYDLLANDLFSAIAEALSCMRAGSEEVSVYEELAEDDWEQIDWQACLTPDERLSLA